MANLSNNTLREKFHDAAGLRTKNLSVMVRSPSRIAGHGPVSVIDIGSNSVRLVSYERLSRSPTPIFNEKALCGLGKGVADTGVLNDEAVEAAIAAIHRFKAISDQLGSVELHVLATAAARDAANGEEFIERVAEIAGSAPIVLTGSEEARYSGYGVISGIHRADGVMGDMGGGSLEIADIKNATTGPGETFPLGGLRLQDTSKGAPKKALEVARAALNKNAILKEGKGRRFFAIGGTWRSLASLHMKQNNYPLHVLHHYAVDAKKMAEFCAGVVKTDLDEIGGMEAVSKNRAPLIQYGAAVLLALIEEMKPSEVIISALGIREGVLFEQLDDTERDQDGLVAAARELSLLRSRSPDNALELVDWTSSLMKAIDWQETEEQARLRVVACLLSDVGWRAHPDYRGEQSVNTIAHAAFIAIDHPGRAFIALSAYFRHEGQRNDDELPSIARLIDKDMLKRARLLGLAFRAAHLISASMAGALSQSGFIEEAGELVFQVEEDQAGHVGERLVRRLNQIGRITEKSVRLQVGDWR